MIDFLKPESVTPQYNIVCSLMPVLFNIHSTERHGQVDWISGVSGFKFWLEILLNYRGFLWTSAVPPSVTSKFHVLEPITDYMAVTCRASET
jgi:hypothetical protein